MMNDLITIRLESSTIAVLIAGLYSLYSSIDPVAVPQSLYLELAEKLSADYLKSWDYDKEKFEDWIKYDLMIAPKDLWSESELNARNSNDLYFERDMGHIIYVVWANMDGVLG